MALIDFYIRNQRLSKNGPKIVSDSVNYVDFSFTFKTDDWEGMDKWVVIKKGEEVYRANLLNDSVPKETGLNLGEGIWHISLFGENSEGSRITTNSVTVEVEKSSVSEGEVLPVIELSEAEQISAKAQSAFDLASEIMDKIESGEIGGGGSGSGTQGTAGEDGYTPVRGIDYWTEDDIAEIKGYVDEAILGGVW